MGVASFKIEGRMKSPEYVRDVARIWRRLIDEHRGADDRELRALAAIFSRGGLTDGYYVGRIDSSMLGIRSAEDKESTRTLEPFRAIERKLPAELHVTVKRGAPLTLCMRAGEKQVTVTGEPPEDARTAPLDREAVERCFSKLGNTPYGVSRIEIELDEGLMVPVSAMNALRRQAIDRLTEGEERSPSDFTAVAPRKPKKDGESDRTAVFYDPKRIPEEAREFFDVLYVPLHLYDGSVNGVLLPSVIFDSEREEVRRQLLRARELGALHALVGNAGHVALARECGMTVHGDFRLNVTNSRSAAVWEEELSDYILSPELTLPRIRDIGGRGRTVVYGRIPLMVTEKCVGKEIGDCRSCEAGKNLLTDRRGVRFPVLREWDHRSLIVNSVPVYMADRQRELASFGIRRIHFIFTVESADEIGRVITAYKRSLPPKDDIRRIPAK